MKKRTALFLTALLLSALFLCLTACEGGAGDPEGSETEPPKQILYHAADYNDYTIVRSDISSETITHVTVDLRGRMQEAGSTVGIATDWVKRGEEVPETQKEILIGTTNRADSIAACAALRFEEFTVSRTDDHIVIVGGSDEATACAVEWFIDNILSVEEDGFAQYNGKYLYEKTYRLNNATICGVPISGFRIACSWTEAKKAAELLRDTIAAETGYKLELRDTASSQDGKASRIRIEADGKMEKNTYAVLCDEDGILIKGSDILAARCGVSAWINGILSSDTFVYTPGELYSGPVTYREITYYLKSDAKAGGDGSEASPFSTATS